MAHNRWHGEMKSHRHAMRI